MESDKKPPSPKANSNKRQSPSSQSSHSKKRKKNKIEMLPELPFSSSVSFSPVKTTSGEYGGGLSDSFGMIFQQSQLSLVFFVPSFPCTVLYIH